MPKWAGIPPLSTTAYTLYRCSTADHPAGSLSSVASNYLFQNGLWKTGRFFIFLLWYTPLCLTHSFDISSFRVPPVSRGPDRRSTTTPAHEESLKIMFKVPTTNERGTRCCPSQGDRIDDSDNRYQMPRSPTRAEFHPCLTIPDRPTPDPKALHKQWKSGVGILCDTVGLWQSSLHTPGEKSS